MPQKTTTKEEKRERARQYYQKHKDWMTAYQNARNTGRNIYDVCRERGVEIPDSYEKKKQPKTQTREEILAQQTKRQRERKKAIRTIQAFFRRFIARKKEKERKAKQTEEEAREKKRLHAVKRYNDIRNLADIVGCSYGKMNKMIREYRTATGRSVFQIPDYFKDIPIIPYFTDEHWKVLETL
jgi:competence CoiA-like predicted nuclease